MFQLTVNVTGEAVSEDNKEIRLTFNINAYPSRNYTSDVSEHLPPAGDNGTMANEATTTLLDTTDPFMLVQFSEIASDMRQPKVVRHNTTVSSWELPFNLTDINRKLLPLSVQNEIETREAQLQLALITDFGFYKSMCNLLYPYSDTLGVSISNSLLPNADKDFDKENVAATTKLPHDKGETGSLTETIQIGDLQKTKLR